MTTAYPLAWPDGWPRTPALKRQRAKFQSVQKKWDSYTDAQGQRRTREWYDRKALTIAAGNRRLLDELDRLGAIYVTVSTNVPITRDGAPRSDRREPEDVGAAAYFQLDGKPMVLACDKWERVADNLAAIAGHIEAMRAQERYGVGSVGRAFAGYEALPPPRSSQVDKPWREVLGISAALSEVLEPRDVLALAESRYKTRVKEVHPDNGGDHEAIVALNRAIASARDELR